VLVEERTLPGSGSDKDALLTLVAEVGVRLRVSDA
jgi:hypothetical protein